MVYLLDVMDGVGDTPDKVRSRLAEYRAYLERVAARFPPGAYAFATASWHYDPSDHKCPHDAWVDSVGVVERGTGSRAEVREVDMTIRLLGAYHDGFLVLRYVGVCGYAMEALDTGTGTHRQRGHGDWLVDEITLTPDGNVQHEAILSAAKITVRCVDIECDWVPSRPQDGDCGA
jgi:hypothetical protein